jgi:hypothetical protein
MPDPESESEPELSFDEASKQLIDWTKALLYEAETTRTEIQEILGKSNDKTFPSRRQEALLVFRAVREKLAEVHGFVQTVERSIKRSGKH